jgi:hypothetical protein
VNSLRKLEALKSVPEISLSRSVHVSPGSNCNHVIKGLIEVELVVRKQVKNYYHNTGICVEWAYPTSFSTGPLNVHNLSLKGEFDLETI